MSNLHPCRPQPRPHNPRCILLLSLRFSPMANLLHNPFSNNLRLSHMLNPHRNPFNSSLRLSPMRLQPLLRHSQLLRPRPNHTALRLLRRHQHPPRNNRVGLSAARCNMRTM